MSQLGIIKKFCENANYYMIKYKNKGKEEFGKIIENNELSKVDLTKHEIKRSIDYKNGDKLFVFDLKPICVDEGIDNPIQLLLNNLECARAIELVYPDIFRWAFDGISVRAYAIIPSGSFSANSTISRYGGTEKFFKILNQHLDNIKNMSKGMTPDYNFIKNKILVPETEISLGSINLFNMMYSIQINLDMNYDKILENSKKKLSIETDLNVLDMKYWAREINPDFIHEAKHVKLNDSLELNTNYNKVYPPCIINMINLKEKTNPVRFLIAVYLLSVHSPKDAKFIYNSVLSEQMKEHASKENHFGYIKNNMKNYSCPTCSVLKRYCEKGCKYIHPLTKIQEQLEK